MAINYINTGSSSNKGDGDTLRGAFNKINTNFRYLTQVTGITANADLSAEVFLDNTLHSGITVSYNTLTQKASLILSTATTSTLGGVKIGSGLTVDENGFLSSKADLSAVSMNVIPSESGIFDIGSPEKEWKRLFVSINGIIINGIPISIGTQSNLLVNGVEVGTGPAGPAGPTGPQGEQGPAGPQGIPGNYSIGNFTFDANTMNIPLTGILNSGGTGRVGSVEISTNVTEEYVSTGFTATVFDIVVTDPDTGSVAFDFLQSSYPDLNTKVVGGSLITGNDLNGATGFGGSPASVFVVQDASSSTYWRVVTNLPPSTTATIKMVPGYDLTFEIDPVLTITGSELVLGVKTGTTTTTGLYVTSTHVTVTNSNNSWQFNANGELVFPDGTVQTTAASSGSANTGNVKFVDNTIYTETGSLAIYTSGGTTGNNRVDIEADQFNVDVTNRIALYSGGELVIATNNTSSSQSWTLQQDGSIVFPDASIQSTAWTGSYSPANAADWAEPAPTTIAEAINRLAALVKTLNGGTGA